MLTGIILRLMQINQSVFFSTEKNYKKNACNSKPVFKIDGRSIEFVHRCSNVDHIRVDNNCMTERTCYIGVMLRVGKLRTFCFILVN